MPPVRVDRLVAFSDGTAAGIRAVIDMYLADTAEIVRALESAVEVQDAAAIGMLAHRGGGSSGACGADVLAALLFEMQQAPRSAAGDRALCRRISRELADVTRFLQGYAARLESATPATVPPAARPEDRTS